MHICRKISLDRSHCSNIKYMRDRQPIFIQVKWSSSPLSDGLICLLSLQVRAQMAILCKEIYGETLVSSDGITQKIFKFLQKSERRQNTNKCWLTVMTHFSTPSLFSPDIWAPSTRNQYIPLTAVSAWSSQQASGNLRVPGCQSSQVLLRKKAVR